MNKELKAIQNLWLAVLLLSIISLGAAAYNLGFEKAKADNTVNCKVVDR
jgi:hypothetical protein